jgi:hypothetical protein
MLLLTVRALPKVKRAISSFLINATPRPDVHENQPAVAGDGVIENRDSHPLYFFFGPRDAL